MRPEESPARSSGRSSASAQRIQHPDPESPSDSGSDPAGSLYSSFSDNNAIDPPPSAPEGRYCCPHPHCDKRFSRISDAVKHINQTHEDNFALRNPFIRCSVCEKVYTRKGLKSHHRRQHPEQPLPSNAPANEAHRDGIADLPAPFPRHLPAAPVDIDALHKFYRLEPTWIHAKWKPPLQKIHLSLLQRINSTDATVSDESFSAYLLLPGFLEAIRLANRLPGAHQLRIEPPINYLLTFASEEHAEHPEYIIITTANALYSRVSHSLATKPRSPKSRQVRELLKIITLSQIGRISKAARLADALERTGSPNDDDGDSNFRKISPEHAIAAVSDLFPAASTLDGLDDNLDDEREYGHPLQVTAAEVAHSITNLSIDRAAGFSGWSNRLLKQLYLGCDPSHQQAIAENYAQLFNSLLKGELPSTSGAI